MATHGTEYNEVGVVRFELDHLNRSGYPQTYHGHQSGYTSRTASHVHAWWVRPENRWAVVRVKPKEAKVRPKAAFAKGAGGKT